MFTDSSLHMSGLTFNGYVNSKYKNVKDEAKFDRIYGADILGVEAANSPRDMMDVSH